MALVRRLRSGHGINSRSYSITSPARALGLSGIDDAQRLRSLKLISAFFSILLLPQCARLIVKTDKHRSFVDRLSFGHDRICREGFIGPA